MTNPYASLRHVNSKDILSFWELIWKAEGVIKNFHLLVLFQNNCNSPGWIKPKAGVQTVCVIHIVWKGLRHLGHFCHFQGAASAGNWVRSSQSLNLDTPIHYVVISSSTLKQDHNAYPIFISWTNTQDSSGNFFILIVSKDQLWQQKSHLRKFSFLKKIDWIECI